MNFLILASRIETSLLNTVLGMTTVFVVLIIITLLISLLGFIPKLKKGSVDQNKIEQGESQNLGNRLDSLNQEVKANSNRNWNVSNENLLNNQELIAVITAAIMEYLGDDAPSDGLIIRNIKRANVNSWKKSKS